MKRITKFVFVLCVFGLSQLRAQSDYKMAAGLGIDFGSGQTYVGPSAKFFLAPDAAIEADVLFASGSTLIQAFYEYHGAIESTDGLKWYAGVGPGVTLYDGGSNFLIRPLVGLDFKFNTVPLALTFDWRPALGFNGDGSDFEAARFGLGFRYVLD
ncbi:hypothetical protein Celal_2866 [Cellulophaga algicola DSM 14237]|uniref:Uncharacterized protein n=1 Tax=Cellulophaga algicola (strain DSM 14237 / IC166 / ACAM 630) TaxID=688270 RepID=E6XDK2_CELAD|nr:MULTISPECIES: hypothetical protein [Cellulophaga]ADV50144.1 hypothetical protein Celal_2866 [Cellulophaga algicola DSM 14237]